MLISTNHAHSPGETSAASDSASPGAVVTVPGGTWLLTDSVVTLVPLRADHIPAVTTACADAQARRMLAHAITLRGTAAERQAVVADYLLGPWARAIVEPFAVAIPDRRSRGGLRVIGVRWLQAPAPGRRVFSCGGWVTARERRQGYGSRALRLVCAYAEALRGAIAVSTGTRGDNAPAQANLRAAGFHLATKADAPYRFGPPDVQPAFLEEWVRIASDPQPLALASQRRLPTIR